MIVVQGTRPLSGTVKIQGSKNAVLPMMAAALLHEGTTVFTNVPRIQDVFCMMGILRFIGCVCRLDGHVLSVDASRILRAEIPEEYMKAMRSSIMMLGALLARQGEALTRYPGGCLIGSRPIDLHIKALKTLGAEITEEAGNIYARTERLRGAEIHFPYPSVGATENALLAAVLADGTTRITGAAKEPEIQELCLLLNQMGGRIFGIGTDRLTVEGVKRLSGAVRKVPGDRIVAGTYLAAVLACGGDARLEGVNPDHMEAVVSAFESCGGRIETGIDDLEISASGRPEAFEIITGPYPDFPTDLQSPAMTVMATARGESRIVENVFENRYRTAAELEKMGANIRMCGEEAFIRGVGPTPGLLGAHVTAWDLRGGAALVTAGLAARGTTAIDGCCHIHRGYEDICLDLAGLGAGIQDGGGEKRMVSGAGLQDQQEGFRKRVDDR